MEAANKFAQSGETMTFTLHRLLEGHPTPPALFIDLVVEKCQFINHHFLNTRDHLKVVTSVTNSTASIKFHNILLVDSELKMVTLTNESDLKYQLVQLWTEVQKLLKFYNENDRIVELASIESYYRNFEYKRRMAQLYNYEFY